MENMWVMVVVSLILLLGVREYLSYKERRDMLDRLMAKNLPEYKDNVQLTETPVDEKDPNIVDIDEAQDDIDENNG